MQSESAVMKDSILFSLVCFYFLYIGTDVGLCCNNLTGESLDDHLLNISSNSVLTLSAGCYHLTSLTPIVNMTNITLKGESPTDTIITCSQRIGLVFINIDTLNLENLAIVNCGLTGKNLEIISSFLQNYDVFSIPNGTEFAIIMAYIFNATINNVHISDTNGIGLLTFNLFGTVNSCIFNNNSVQQPMAIYTNDLLKGVGGGLVAIYLPETQKISNTHSIAINDSKFLSNVNYGLSTIRELYHSFTSNDNPYNIGAGGGLTVFLAHQPYRIQLTIDSCTFYENAARYGGGLFVGVLIDVSDSKLTVNNCIFERNGFVFGFGENYNQSFIRSGQGMAIIKDIAYPLSNQNANTSSANNQFLVTNSMFINNVGYSASAVLLFSRYAVIGVGTDLLVFENCHFERNRASIGGALYLFEAKYSGVQNGISIMFADTCFLNNSLLSNYESMVYIPTSGIVELKAVKVTFYGEMEFISNTNTPIHSSSSIIKVFDDISFINNTGTNGGAIELRHSSFFVLSHNCNVLFQNNRALSYGGAIYFETNYEEIFYDCFLYFDNLDITCDINNDCPLLDEINATVRFMNNDSPSGTAVYGSTLESCPWVKNIRNRLNKPRSSINVYELLQNVSLFEFDPPIDNNTVATLPYKITIVEPKQSSIMLGEQLNIKAVAYDQFNHIISSIVSSYINDDLVNGPQKSYLQNTGYFFIRQSNNTEIPISIKSMRQVESQKEIPLKIYSVGSSAKTSLNVTIRDCYPGFQFSNESTPYKGCKCSDEVQMYRSKNIIYECNPETATFLIPNLQWLGRINDTSNIVTAHGCLFDYCKLGVKNVSNGNFDTQCKENFYRTGLLCGQCKDNTSLVFGSNKCEKCTNIYLLFLLGFAAAGFGIMTFIGRIGITVSHGFFNSIVFYCNIVVPFEPFLLTDPTIMLGLSIINLNIGFPLCFFDGMNALYRAYLNFVFPIYLWIVMGIYTVLLHYELFPKRWNLSNASQIFASVMLLSYTSTMQACSNALHPVVLDHGTARIRWAPDPSVVYFNGWHIPLALLSIVLILIYIIPAPLALLFPSITLRTSFGKKFIPVYDAFWAPFRTKFEFWIGLQMFLRAITHVFATTLPYPVNILLLGLFTTTLLFFHIVFKPFKGFAQNVLDIYLLLNVILLVMGSLYFSIQFEHLSVGAESIDSQDKQLAYVAVVVTLAYISILLVICYHSYLSVKCFQNLCNKLVQFFVRKLQKKRVEDYNLEEESNSVSEPINAGPPPVNYAMLREPLLSHGETSLEILSDIINRNSN